MKSPLRELREWNARLISSRGLTEKPEPPTPCEITPRLPQEAGVDEKREFGEADEE